MKKLQLSLESLKVDSFTTDVRTSGRGTVQAASLFEPTGYTYCIQCTGNTGETNYCQTQNSCFGGPVTTCGEQTE
ncbi:MAG TPA: pinensin family lanthipeptide [Longimicrobium sp.]|nr:pinensin family lanthipeptide [Longimicrobium sp.]